ncbi:hypothetical protein C0995_014004 [Termitomyces sp. Mi166|nr:hypothetical protein C0995_014004 [Termitomyces sp. Mi166\
MASFFQKHAHKGQLKALSEAMKVIQEVQPVFDEGGVDVTADARENLLSELQSEYTTLVEGQQPDLAQKAPGLAELIMFYIQVRKAKKTYQENAKNFKSESKILRERVLQDIEQKAVKRLSEEVISRLLWDERLSMDTKQVAKDIETASEVTRPGVQNHTAPSQLNAYDIQRRILSPSEINALFEQAQNQETTATLGHTEMVVQQAARAASPQGLSVPPWMAHAGANRRILVQDTVALATDEHPYGGANQEVAVQDPVELNKGKHRRTNTFGNVTSSTISFGDSSGYDPSSSRGSIHSSESSFNEDNFASIDTGLVYNDLQRLSQEGSLKSF